jgi:hypothetical protein
MSSSFIGRNGYRASVSEEPAWTLEKRGLDSRHYTLESQNHMKPQEKKKAAIGIPIGLVLFGAGLSSISGSRASRAR